MGGLAWVLALSPEAKSAGPPDGAASSCPVAGDEAIAQLLVPIRNQHDIPALAAVIATSKGIAGAGAVGLRKRGSKEPVTADDLWHLGSDTKAMTATLIARLVEQQKVQWESTLEELFPKQATEIHPQMRKVTLLHLLSHRSGLKPNLELRRYAGEDGRAEREKAVREELAKRPTHEPGSHFEYSNLGYIIAGAVVEKITGKTWEQAIQEEVFTPLGMTSVGLGGTGTPGKVDQPWPHFGSGKPAPRNGPAMDNPPVMSPAGRVHCTLRDWAKFIQDQLRGARGEPALLKAESYRKLQSPPFGGDYALGWMVVQREWGGGLVFHHAGDNTMNFANVWIAPQRDFAILVCTNQSGSRGFKSTDEAVGALLRWREAKGTP